MRSGGTLSTRVTCGSAIVGVSFVTEEIFRLVRTLILARMLAPTDFGLMGIAAIAIATLETFSRTGFDRALIQRRESVEEYLDTAWVVSIARGILLTGMLYLLSPLMAAFFRNQEAILVMRALSFLFLLDGLRNVGVVLFQKELAFGRDAIVRQTQVIAEFIVAVWLAFRLGNVWAMVYGMLAGRVAGLLVSYAIQPYRPRLIFEIQKAKTLFDFGRYVWGYTVIILLITQGDDALVGRVLGTAALGFYSLAYKISNFPATGITHVISRVTFPAYSKLQDDILRLGRTYLRTLEVISFLSMAVAGGVFALAPECVALILGERWLPMVPALRILCFLGLIRSIAATAGPVFQALGRPDILYSIKLRELILFGILVYPLILYLGIAGAATVGVLTYLLSLILHFRYLFQLVPQIFSRVSKLLLVSLAAMLLMVVSMLLLKGSLLPGASIPELAWLVLLGGCFYIGFTVLGNRHRFAGLVFRRRRP